MLAVAAWYLFPYSVPAAADEPLHDSGGRPALREEPHSLPAARDRPEVARAARRLRLDLQRPVDPRLRLIEQAGVDGSGLFRGKVHVARSAAEVRALSGRLKPGDRLLLAGTTWKDARFTFSGRGTEQAPILIRAASPGKLVFTGDSEVIFEGAHLVIMDLVFRNVAIRTDGRVVLRLGSGSKHPAHSCILQRIRIDDCNSPDPSDWPKQRAWYLTVRGKDNTIADSVFANMKHRGQMLGAAHLPDHGLQRLHILNNRFIGRPYVDKQNGYEVIQIGWSGEKARSAGSLIQGNVFQRCDGEAEIITLKASDIVVRNNRFLDCQGALSVRAGNRVLIQGNCFDGRNRRKTGGVRLQGSGHVVIDNVFRRLRKPKGAPNYYRWAVSLMAASCENYGDGGDVAGYGRAKDILIAYNRFEGCDSRIAVGIYPRPQYPLLPHNVRVVGNVFCDDLKAKGPFDYVAPRLAKEFRAHIFESANRFEQVEPTK